MSRGGDRPAPRREIGIPETGLVVLVGASGSGKSTFAARHFAPTEVLSSDRFRALVCDDPADQRASGDAFELLHLLARKRLRNRRLAVVDATNVERAARRELLRIAREEHALADALVLALPLARCLEGDARRRGRRVGEGVVREQHALLQESLRRLADEGFRRVHVLRTPEEVASATVLRERLPCDRREERGPFDVIGDVHGCAGELRALLRELGYGPDGSHPAGRRVIFLGDLVDRGPEVVEVLRLAMAMVRSGRALALMGNHEAKLLRWLEGRQPRRTHGLDASIEQLEREAPAFREEVRRFIRARADHYVLDGGRLVVAHAGLKEALHGRAGEAVRSFCLYGDTTGEKDEDGLPIRLDWAREYRGSAAVVYGHTPLGRTRWVNGTICVDTGCVFGGELSALRWPERALVSVPARTQHYPPVRPLPG